MRLGTGAGGRAAAGKPTGAGAAARYLARGGERGGEMGKRRAAARGVCSRGGGGRGNIDRKTARDIVPLRGKSTGQIKGDAGMSPLPFPL